MQRPPRAAVASCLSPSRAAAHAGGIALALLALCPAAAAPAPAALGSPFARPPLPASSVITGGFGEIRSNHFHAGLDFSTGGRVGVAVRAPLAGWVERVRSSGVGYGRSLYLRTADGRTLVFGHLDAFEPRLAAHMDSLQRAGGQYEQDVFPEPGRFRYDVADLLAWTGSSGAGGPHMHLEVRRGDFALHPLRAGYVAADREPPRLLSVTLEPLDEHSYVERGVMPLTRRLGAAPETVLVEGRVRAVVSALDALGGRADLPVWSVSLETPGVGVEARLDSISWDGEMSQIGLLVDRGRIAGTNGWILWAPAGMRPRFLRTSTPDSLPAGTIEVRAGDPPRLVRLRTSDAAGNSVAREIVLRAPLAGETGPDTARAGAGRTLAEPQWSFSALPARRLRVRVTGAPAGLRAVRIERERDGGGGAAAVFDGAGWSAVLDMRGIPDAEGLWIKGRLPDGKPWWQRGAWIAWPAGMDALDEAAPGVSVGIGPGQVFEPQVMLTRMLARDTSPGAGLSALTPTLQWWPADLPLRRAAPVQMTLPAGVAPERVGLYRRDRAGRRWEFVRARYDSTSRVFRGESSELGEFALLRDDAPPVVELLAAPREAAAGAYSRWTLRARVSDAGSGVEARESAFRVDGLRVPSEYDPEDGQLRWRPLTPPRAGRHTYEVTVIDRAGLRTVKRGSFVLDSPQR